MDALQNEIAKFSSQEDSIFQKVITIVLIAGAINWGLVAYNGTDLVRLLANLVSYPKLDYYIKLVVGLAGIIMLYKFYIQCCKKNTNTIILS